MADEELVGELRQMAREGVDVPRLIDLVRGRVGSGTSRFAVIVHFRWAFGIPLEVAMNVGGWSGFGDGDGAFSDEDVQRLVGPAIEAAVRSARDL